MTSEMRETSAELRMSNEDRTLVTYLRARQADNDQISGAAADLIERLAPVPVYQGFGVGPWAQEALDGRREIMALRERARTEADITPEQIEAAARVVDPNAWNAHDHGQTNPVWGDVPRQVSLKKACELADIYDPPKRIDPG